MDIKYILKNAELIPNCGNNKIKRFTDNKFDLIIKFYDQQSLLKHQREIYFYEFLNKKKITSVPKLYFYSYSDRFSIFEYINNDKLDIVFNNELLKIFANFINDINADLNANEYKYNASDAGFSDFDHYQNVMNRLDLYNKFSFNNKQFNEESEIFSKCKNYLEYFVDNNYLSTGKNLVILSPSDYGLHNFISNNSNSKFIDFEFAGLDDPVKLVCDFIFHPRNNLSMLNLNYFSNELRCVDEKTLQKINTLYPIFVIKWILIILNYVDTLNLRKKENLILDFNLSKYKFDQLFKAKNYLNLLQIQ